MPTRESYKQGTPNWIDLATPDCEAAKEFYGGLMGWEFESNPTPQGGEYLTASCEGKACAGIMEQPEPMKQAGAPAAWNTYLAVDDVAECCTKVEAGGGAVVMPPMSVGDSGEMAVISDPSGAMCGLWQAKDSIGCEVVNEDGALIWNELTSDNLAKAAPFYAETFGMEITEEDMGGPDPYLLFNIDGEPVAGGSAPMKEGLPNYWATYMCVPDIDTCVAKAVELGGEATVPAFDTPVGRMAGLKDPQGGFFMVMKPAHAGN